jgi:hypothetical protein
MKGKKETKVKEMEESAREGKDMLHITTKAELKTYISSVRDKLLKEQAAPIFAMVAMQQVMSLESIYDLLDSHNKEILQEIWVKLSQSGFHLRKPPLLFGEAEA